MYNDIILSLFGSNTFYLWRRVFEFNNNSSICFILPSHYVKKLEYNIFNINLYAIKHSLPMFAFLHKIFVA